MNNKWFKFVLKDYDRNTTREQWRKISQYLRIYANIVSEELCKGKNGLNIKTF
ncbi:MAG: hypothetical protein WC389_08000 [Lutibacter sp.]|jgi:hypothetical protein